MRKILVIGGGSIGERHVRCFGHTGRALVSLYEINDEVRQRVGSTYSLPQTFATFEDALEQDFDAAVICTPAHLHISMAQALANKGCHLLIEKPLSTSFDGVDELERMIEDGGLQVSIAYVTRAHPSVIAMREAIQSGRFGKPVNLAMASGQHFPFYRPAYREIYYTKHETGGGAIQDAITHMMNAAEWLVGPITRLVADAEHCVLEGVDVEDTVHMMTRHDNVLGSFSLNQHQAKNETRLTVVCDKGTLRYEAGTNRLLSCVDPDSDWTVEADFTLERDDLFVRQADAFLDCLEGKASPACPLEEAKQTLKVNLAALESVRERKWIEL